MATVGHNSAQYTRLLDVCRRSGIDRQAATELVQEAHLRLLEYQHGHPVPEPKELIRRILVSLISNYYHREYPKTVCLRSVDKLDRHGALIDPAPDITRTLNGVQQLARVVRLLNAVSPRTCQIFIAQRMGYSYAEIATEFGIGERTVEKHIASGDAVLSGRPLPDGRSLGHVVVNLKEPLGCT